MLSMDEGLERYANLILRKGVNLKKGEYIVINADIEHRDIVLKLVEQGYKLGASMVNVIYRDDMAEKVRLENSSYENLEVYPEGTIAELKSLLKKRGVYISLAGAESPEIFRGVDSDKIHRLIKVRYEKLEFFTKAIMADKIKWNVSSAVTDGLAKKILENKGQEGSNRENLWRVIFDVCMVDDKNYLELWDEHNRKIKERRKKLNEMQIDELHFKAPGTDLKIGLHRKARWVGGGSVTPWGEEFMANIPTEEVFTAPDYRRVNGFFESTRPLVFRNVLVEKLGMLFKNGKVVDIWGSDGVESIKKLLDMDKGARHLGEVALVEKNSRIFKSGLVFYEILYDENAASHIALGAGYTECIIDGDKLNSKEKKEVGLNSSKLHMDIMIGSTEMDVTALNLDGKEMLVMKKGEFIL